MKALFILIAFTITAFTVNAQDLKISDVPDAVKSKFSSLYPDVNKISWEKENNNFEAEFQQNQSEISAIFDAGGNLIETKSEISFTSLPSGVAHYLANNLAGEKISEAEKVVHANGTITYEAEIGNTDYKFDSNGNFLNKEDDSPDDKDIED